MEVMTMIEKLEGNIPEFNKVNVKVNANGTVETVNIVGGLLESIGKIYEIVHYRKINEIKYVTYIKGKNLDVAINGGLTSGYGGIGSLGFAEILEKTGVSRDKAERLTQTKYINGEELNDATIIIKYF